MSSSRITILLNAQLRLIPPRNGINSCCCFNSRPLSTIYSSAASKHMSPPTRSFVVARLSSLPPIIRSQSHRPTLRPLHCTTSLHSPSPSPPEPPKSKLKRLNPFNTRENITNIPNLLTVSRLIAAPVIGYLIIHDQHVLAVSLLAYASFTDLVDGWIARKWNLQTVIGTVLDPMADKILMTVLTVSLAVKGFLPVWLAAIILGRDVGMGLFAFYFRWISLPPPKTLSRYFDFSLPSIEVRPTMISKVNTALQLALLGTCTMHPLLGEGWEGVLGVMQYVVATTTVWSGASYVYTKDALRILPKDGDKERERKEGEGKAKL